MAAELGERRARLACGRSSVCELALNGAAKAGAADGAASTLSASVQAIVNESAVRSMALGTASSQLDELERQITELQRHPRQ